MHQTRINKCRMIPGAKVYRRKYEKLFQLHRAVPDQRGTIVMRVNRHYGLACVAACPTVILLVD
jgi:hypothetical protein